ncbi:MAG: alpha-hydroxy-acid oxidizing protein, partial [Acidobacteriota bacterium]|nr:alpha-hydroxy-acid oxidizing protein [Acidobacteriota bacterium]
MKAQHPPATTAGRRRIAPRDELVNTLEFETEAGKVLAADVFRTVSGSDRAPFDRITFRPRMMVNCVGLDLSTELVGVPLFAPIIVGPMADQRLFHAEAERATVRGASLAQAAVVVSAAASLPIETLAKETTSGLFYQVFAADDVARNRSRAEAAIDAGCKAVFVTVGVTGSAGRPADRIEWAGVEGLRRAVSVPVMVKGIMSVDDARAALRAGAQAIVVSNYGQAAPTRSGAPLDVLSAIVDAVGGQVPVLVDGGFRRGTDI